ncbi:hypothetical protein AVEN_90430-1 [Araneus ventricosus]|uniref:Uncharacterized protein n=1 Tax=Araneus ventricosus TaxID=182803 RepID=A0A4Y2N5I5_ARAVE|nr:hypothetical protein AVEN_90430-1 [Araneus ventricosus]
MTLHMCTALISKIEIIWIQVLPSDIFGNNLLIPKLMSGCNILTDLPLNDRDVANGERQVRSRGSSVDSQRSKSRSRSHSPFFDKEDRGSDGRDKWSKSP